MPQNSAAYAVGRIRVLEGRLLDRDRLRRLLDGSVAEAVKLLAEAGYGGGEGDYETMLARELDEACALVRSISPEPRVTDAFLIRYDYHNLKVLLKTRSRQREAEGLLLPCGALPLDALRRAAWEGDPYGLPEEMKNALIAWNARTDRHLDPRALGQLLDAALFAQQDRLARQAKHPFLSRYISAQHRMTELLAALRVRRQGGGAEQLAFLPNPGPYLPVLEGNEESVGAVVAGVDGGWGPLLEQPAVAFLRTGRAAALEKAMDDYLLGLTRPYRHDPFSVVPVVGYLLARESEARNIRMILVGKANGAPREALEERLRDPYA